MFRKVLNGSIFIGVLVIGFMNFKPQFQKILPLNIRQTLFNSPTKKKAKESKKFIDQGSIFGFDLNKLSHYIDPIEKNDVFSNLLVDNGMSYEQVNEIIEKCKNIFKISNIKFGKDFHVILDGKTRCPVAYVYEPDQVNMLTIYVKDSISVRLDTKPIETCEEVISCEIKTTLWDAILEQGHNAELIDMLEDAYGSTVNFHKANVGDKFKAIVIQSYIDNEAVGLEEMKAAYYQRGNREVYTFQYRDGKKTRYYDEKGKPTKGQFLNAPLRFSRISSRYNLKRFHPVQKRVKAHLGTDYAAATGTPILAVGDGVIINRGFTSGNGNYVKLKHNNVYTTQYLHMSRFRPGQRVGSHVSQGDVIGYVGSTGLATGPHVCFRFWKNGRQVDHLRLKEAVRIELGGSDMKKFKILKDQLKKRLDAVQENEYLEVALN